MVVIVLGGTVVVTAGVLVVALAYLVGDVPARVVSIDVAHEALTAVALRTGGLLLAASRHTRRLQLVTIVLLHVVNVVNHVVESCDLSRHFVRS